MTVTKRFIMIIALGVPFAALLSLTGLGLLAFLLYNAVCGGFLLLDWIVSPPPSVLEAERDKDTRLFFKAENEIRIFIRNGFPRPLKLTLKDELPDWHFRIVSDKNMSRRVQPGERAEFSYTVVPAKRGSFAFNGVYARYAGLLGLCEKFWRFPLPAEYQVYPNLRDLGKYRLMTRKARLLPRGERPAPAYGEGSEFESLREYVVGDDVRKLNWPATARENKPIVNQYQAETNQPVFILVDAGRPMSYSVKGFRKLDRAINAALILADIVNRQNDLSGLMVFDTEVRAFLKPGKGQAHRSQVMEALYHVQGAADTPDYEKAFREFAARQKRRGLVFVFTDFETAEEARGLADDLRIIGRRHTAAVILMKNDSILRLAERAPAGKADVYRREAAKEWLDERRKVIRMLNAEGILCVETDAEDFAAAAVNRYLAAKNRRGAG
ncbi:MAG: DUF58 domain-containing protein [Firmicutes bacterium]|nr:DUF58 domain-containing protein [Bacillota bacterium]